ncbi:DEAD/DEAH box helicase family protein [Oerskovia gallyi]|uniref:DEAD/DEAH box helicase family protein n=1 Tax=Oerskovia gallyi TaxID=2762226 RepID=UPI001CD8E25F
MAGWTTCCTSTRKSSASSRPSPWARLCRVSSGSQRCTRPVCPRRTASALWWCRIACRSCSRRPDPRLISPTGTTRTRGPGRSSTFPSHPRSPACCDADADPEHPTWRAKVQALPELDEAPLRPAQIMAITGTEQSLAQQRFDRSLIQMATGAGKTRPARHHRVADSVYTTDQRHPRPAVRPARPRRASTWKPPHDQRP